jgi:predicted PurR-regulated permease PerM
MAPNTVPGNSANCPAPAPELQPPSEGWLTRERVLVLLLAAATAVAFYLCYRMVLPLLPAITWALAIAVVARPLHVWIGRRVHNANLAALLSVIAVCVLIVAPGLLIAQQLLYEVIQKVKWVQEHVTEEKVREAVGGIPGGAPLAEWMRERDIKLQPEADRLGGSVSENLAPVFTGSVYALFQFGVMLFVLYFCFRDRRQALGALRALVPLSEPEIDRLLQRVSDTIHATVNGTIIVGVVQGTLGGLLFWVLDIPSPLFWGVLMALASAIPGLSACGVWAPNALILMFQGRWVAGIIVAIGAVLVIGLIDNMLLPLVVGKRLRLHILPTFIAIVGGVSVFGVSGLILGPTVLVLALALAEVWRRRMYSVSCIEEGVNLESPAQRQEQQENAEKVSLDPKKSALLEKVEV